MTLALPPETWPGRAAEEAGEGPPGCGWPSLTRPRASWFWRRRCRRMTSGLEEKRAASPRAARRPL